MTKPRIVIVGGGLAGLSTAWHFQSKGIPCIVLEKEAAVGGLCRSRASHGFTFDICGHLLHFKHGYTLRLVQHLLGNELKKHKRNSWIYFDDTYVKYPFQANLYGLSPKIAEECLLGYIKARSRRDTSSFPATFEEWIHVTFGDGIAKHFMMPYNSKFWTVDPGRMNCAWMKDVIPIPTIKELVEGTLAQSKRELGYNTTFWYPEKGGIQRLIRAFVSELRDVRTSCAVREIDLKRKRVVTSAGTERYDFLVFAAPLPEFPLLAGADMPAPVRALFDKLNWNSILNINIGARGRAPGRHWIYFPQKNIPFFRVGYYSNFARLSAPAGAYSMYVEVAFPKHSRPHRAEVSAKVRRELVRLGLIEGEGAIVCEDTNYIEYGYPIYDSAYSSVRNSIIDFLRPSGIYLAGRYGAWRYLSMEGAIAEGKVVHESICGNI